jgi:membrane protease YdiL (CAAX protease family)
MGALSSRVLPAVKFGLVASLIVGFGAGIWTALIGINLNTTAAFPWAVPAMAIVLWFLWEYLGGKGLPRSTSETRASHLRAFRVSRRVFSWALAAGILSLVALAGFWIVLVEITGFGGNPTIPDYSLYPPLTVALGLVMGSLVSPITEEAAFRGYFQVELERLTRPTVAIVVSSFLFALWHGPTQGFVWSKLLFYFLVGISFGLIAYLTNSVLPAIPVHILGDLTFFFLIWPYDATRPSIWESGPSLSFWISVAEVIIFTALAVLAYRQLARVAKPEKSQPSPLIT